MQSDPSWVQNHLSPMWALYGIRDTMSFYYPNGKNLAWLYHDREFRYLAYSCLKPKTMVDHVVIKKGLKIHTTWLNSWTNTDQIFIQKLSPYLLKKFKLKSTYLEDGPAQGY
jgi:hypothetical protein